MGLPVVRTGNTALDRFLDEVRQHINSTTQATKVPDTTAAVLPGAADMEKFARDLMATRVFRAALGDRSSFDSLAYGAPKVTLNSTKAESLISSATYALDGNLLVSGTVTAAKIDSRGLTIKDAAGNVILGAGTGLAVGNVVGLGALATQSSVGWSSVSAKPANVTALTGAEQIKNDLIAISESSGTLTLTGGAGGTVANVVTGNNKITSGNVGTYIASAAISEAYIGNLNASKITAGTLSADRIGANTITSDKIGTNTLSAVTVNTTGMVRSMGSYSSTYSGGWRASLFGENYVNTANESGVFGYGYNGVTGYTSSTNIANDAAALVGRTQGNNGLAISIRGYMQWIGPSTGYKYPPPDGNAANFLCADGTWKAAGGSTSFGTTASALGASSGGSASTASRSDHVHALPTAAAVGAATNLDITTAINNNNSYYVSPNFATIGHTHSYATSSDVSTAIANNNIGLRSAFAAGPLTFYIPGVGTFYNCTITY